MHEERGQDGDGCRTAVVRRMCGGLVVPFSASAMNVYGININIICAVLVSTTDEWMDTFACRALLYTAATNYS